MRGFNWKLHYGRLAAGIAAALTVGWLSGHMLWVLLISSVLYLGWHLHNLRQLSSWLQRPRRNPPESLGLWADLLDRIDRMEKQRRRQRRELRAVVHEFQRATNAFPDATLVIDDEDAIVWFNIAAAELLGLRKSEDLGTPVTNLIRDPAFANWLAVHGQIDSSLHLHPPQARERLLNVTAVQYRENQRLLIFRDITDVHRAEKIRRDFVSNVSHELRTPLTVFSGYLEMFDEQCDPGLQKAVTQMRSKCDEMQDMLQDLIDLSRLQSGELQREESEQHVPAILMQIREQAGELSQDRHPVQFNVDPNLNLLGHGADLASAFRNLVINAIKYSPDGGAIVVDWLQDDSGAAVFRVSDHGLGIPSRDLPRITERFYRVGTDRARSTGGTGLGLSIVKHVMKVHAGRLDIESEYGSGSTFTCTFPEKRVRRNGNPR